MRSRLGAWRFRQSGQQSCAILVVSFLFFVVVQWLVDVAGLGLLRVRFVAGVSQLKSETVKLIQENIGEVTMIFDFDGTLVAAGAGLDEKDGQLMSSLVSVLEGGVGINTAQAPQYMAERGGAIFPAKAFELGLRVEHMDGTVFISRAPDFARELKSITEYLSARPDQNLSLVVKNGGFAVKFTDEDGRLAKGADVDAVVLYVQSLVEGSKELISVQTDGFIDVCSGFLNKGTAIQQQLKERPFRGSFCIAAGDSGTDEAMFPFVPVSIRVGRSGETCATDRLSGHKQMLEVIAWIVYLRLDFNESRKL